MIDHQDLNGKPGRRAEHQCIASSETFEGTSPEAEKVQSHNRDSHTEPDLPFGLLPKEHRKDRNKNDIHRRDEARLCSRCGRDSRLLKSTCHAQHSAARSARDPQSPLLPHRYRRKTAPCLLQTNPVRNTDHRDQEQDRDPASAGQICIGPDILCRNTLERESKPPDKCGQYKKKCLCDCR